MNFSHELLTLIRSRYPVVGVQTWEERRLEKILAEVAASLEVPFWSWDTVEGLVHRGTGNAMYNTGRPDQVLGYLRRSAEDGLYFLKDLHHHLGDSGIQRALRSAAEAFRKDRRCIILAASSFEIPSDLEKEIMLVPLALPDIEEIKRTLYRTVSGLEGGSRIRIDMDRAEMNRFLEALRGLTLEEIEYTIVEIVLEDRVLGAGDIPRVLERKKRSLMRDSALDFVPAGEDLGEVAGMSNLKAWLERRRQAFGPDAKAFGLEPPKGILLVGVQGCGKSMLAKAVAREWGLPLLRLDPGTLYDKFIGESEKRLRAAISSAEAMAPAVLWIDEIEKGLAAAGGTDADGGLSRRMLGTFLGWMQDRKSPVFLVATANDISALPPELIRKGRFDEIFFIDLPDATTREAVFKIHLARRGRDPGRFDLEALAAGSEGFSGAEIEQAVVGGLYSAFAAHHELDTAMLLRELEGTRPLSVTMREKVEALRAWAATRTVPADGP